MEHFVFHYLSFRICFVSFLAPSASVAGIGFFFLIRPFWHIRHSQKATRLAARVLRQQMSFGKAHTHTRAHAAIVIVGQTTYMCSDWNELWVRGPDDTYFRCFRLRRLRHFSMFGRTEIEWKTIRKPNFSCAHTIPVKLTRPAVCIGSSGLHRSTRRTRRKRKQLNEIYSVWMQIGINANTSWQRAHNFYQFHRTSDSNDFCFHWTIPAPPDTIILQHIYAFTHSGIMVVAMQLRWNHWTLATAQWWHHNTKR